ncbi:MAG: DUF3576 domain-containing protein [Micropepsaceae bacterium]
MRMPAVVSSRFRKAALIALVAAVPGLAACETLGLVPVPFIPENTPENLTVDPYIWAGAQETLSFLPIASADPVTGRIETGWGEVSAGSGEQVRVIVQIYPGQVNASSVAVSVYRRVNGVDAGVNPQTAITVQQAILLRARQIKTALDEEMY